MSPETPWQKAVYQDELDTLRAEIERLTHLVQEIEDRRRNLEDVSCNQQADIMHLRAAVECLTRERDVLREAINELWQELSYMDGEKPHRLCGIAKRALKASETPADSKKEGAK